MSNQPLSRIRLTIRIIIRLFIAIPILCAMFFLPAGTFDYWEAWVYLGILLCSMLFVAGYLLKYSPELLERRLRTKEKEEKQKLIIKILHVFFFLLFIIPGFDKRFGWSNVPLAVVIGSDILILLGYGITFLVFRENRYASRIIEVEQEQQVISTGPYAIVRHPMYLGISLMYILTPLALGSYWAMLSSILIVPILVARIQDEENVLSRDLTGYAEYMSKVKYRLLPGIW